MVAIPFPLSTSPGLRVQESAGRLVNVFAEPLGEDMGAVWRRAPGASVFAETANSGFRGGLEVGSNLIAAWNGTLKAIDDEGAETAIDSLSGTDSIFIARNNKTSPDIVIVSEDGTFTVDVSGQSVTTYPDGDVGSPNAVCFHDSYFMFTHGNGDIQASAQNGTGINTTDKTRAESNPDGLLRPWSYQGLLYAAGEKTIEVFGPPINATGFPLTRIGYHITPGLIAPHAVAGFEPEFGNPPIYVGADNTVRWLRSITAQPEKISPPDLDRLIAGVSDKTTLKASCYLSGGHAFWQLSSATWTWVFNLNNLKWHERTSYLQARSRLVGSVFAFNKWLTGDNQAGNLLHVDHTLHTEAGEPLHATIESGPVKNFPNRTRVGRADFDFVTGVGIATGADPEQTNPQVEISWSDDAGVTFTPPWFRPLGRQGEGHKRVIVFNTGIAGPMGRRWRLRLPNAVHFGLLGGTQNTEVRGG
jgi:hypothetical protein